MLRAGAKDPACGFDPDPRLLAVTGCGQSADRSKKLDAGFDEDMVKPVDVEGLLITMRRPVGLAHADTGVLLRIGPM